MSSSDPTWPGWMFTARERFTPARGEGWTSYVEWIGFTHIEELVTLDNMLCPELITELVDEDWSFNVHADYRVMWFRDLAYLRRRCDWRPGCDQILGTREVVDPQNQPPGGMTLCGYDILDSFDSISVLTNCGRFPGIIDPQSVNSWGLFSDLSMANSIAAKIRIGFPDDPHCQECRVWQVARDVDLGK